VLLVLVQLALLVFWDQQDLQELQQTLVPQGQLVLLDRLVLPEQQELKVLLDPVEDHQGPQALLDHQALDPQVELDPKAR
jgi:hypothetical protein